VDTTSSDAQQRQEGVTPPRARIFINYRRDDTEFQAKLIYDRLERRFGPENVFLDVQGIQLGRKWLEEVKSHDDSCHIFLSLIGPLWMSIMAARDQAAFVSPATDWVQYEIERALRRDSGICVIPVLIGDDVPFDAEALPGQLRALGEFQQAYVRGQHFESDIEFLIDKLETIARELPEPVTADREEQPPVPVPAVAWDVAPPPDAAHCENVLRQMMDEGSLVLFLGPRMAAAPVGAVEGTSSLPDAEALAAALAKRFRVAQARLPQIAQYVYMTRGRPDLYRTVSRLLTADYEPGPVHRFLARFPGTLAKLGHQKRYQLIVSTNFDTALEKAFAEEREPYDLAVYMASGPDVGKFVHFTYEGPHTTIHEPNTYTSLPIRLDYDYELKRTLIVKIHGAVDGNVGGYRWQENYVITEDHYIDYLSNSPVESLVPVQVLGKLRQSHCLFLGYTVRDWSLRVFLKRIWGGSLGAKSWAIDPNPDALEKEIWATSNVDLYTADLGHYVGMLGGLLSQPTRESAER